MAVVHKILKRDGTIANFERDKISSAIFKAAQSVGGTDREEAESLSSQVVATIEERFIGKIPSVEEIQDIVEEVLIKSGHDQTAKAYILYRAKRAELRAHVKKVPERVRQLVEESRRYFRNPLSEFVYFRTYSRWIDGEGRRETWIETVDRYVDFMRENLGTKLREEEYSEIKEGILNQDIMPSMRLMWGAGDAARASNVCGYNCSYIAPAKLEDFSEIMYLSMCGAGVGFSVESQTAQLLPIIARQAGQHLPAHAIGDSKEGWCDALTLGLRAWYSGKDIIFDYSHIRPAGAKLKTMGGRSSGPEPLRSLLDFARAKIMASQGRRLSNIDIHDIICKIGEVVVMGGVRRTALISLSDLNDGQMRNAKQGYFYMTEPQRTMANNSAVYVEKPASTVFMEEWLSLAKSGTGERGIFNRGGLRKQMPERRWRLFKECYDSSGTNPCGEIILRSKEFCNLTEVVCRAEDNEDTLMRKMRLATILGTYQSTLTKFPYLSDEWRKNCEEERLLGVSLTGQWDCKAVRNSETLRKLKEIAVETNRLYARRFGINESASITCVKPSGTVSQLVDSSSGMHPRHAKYYIRRIRIAAHDPLFKMLRDQKFPYHPEVGQTMDSATTFVFEFPVKAPEGAVVKDDLTALDQLEYWKMVKENYTEHNPSVTVSVGEDEWLSSADWLYNHWDMIGGLSFLPRESHVYKLAPYEEITKEQYEQLCVAMPEADFANIVLYESEDATQGAKEAACVGGVCEFMPDGATPLVVEAGK
ncbi:MAG: ribonucleoside-triphosphate reductase [Candidatus Aenigmarchaeota archaeon]|nr:ribonucleoside-triphosphate reductase [Candidatus Aenigmarchaeota archaeon]